MEGSQLRLGLQLEGQSLIENLIYDTLQGNAEKEVKTKDQRYNTLRKQPPSTSSATASYSTVCVCVCVCVSGV